MVARTGSIARAAERLALSQPALSGHVKSLEEELGLRLFDRNAKGMMLTQTGRRILRHAEQLLTVRDELLAEAKALQGMLHGTLRLGIAGNANTLRIDRWLEILASRHPDISVQLEAAPSARVIEDIITGKLNAGYITTLPSEAAGLAFVELRTFKIRAVAPAAWLDRTSHSPELAPELATLPWILPLPGTICRRVADMVMARHGIRPAHVACVATESIVKELVRNEIGIGFLHEESLDDESLRIRLEPLDGYEGEARVGFAYPGGTVSPLLSAAIAAVQLAWEPDSLALGIAEAPL